MPDLPIEPCSCPLAGWCERHQRKKTAHLHKLCQSDDRHRLTLDNTKPPKDLIDKAKTLIPAIRKWVAAGSPVRTQPEIDTAYTICLGCEFYQPQGHETGTCNKCGCYVNRTGLLNKIKMATENCPLSKW